MPANAIDIRMDKRSSKEFHDFIKEWKKEFTREEINETMRPHLNPMLKDMKRESPSVALAAMTAKTTRQVKRPRAPRIGYRIGVINSNKNFTINGRKPFEKFSAPAMASVLAHGTKERFRRSAKSFGISIGTQSTGSVKGNDWIGAAWDKNVKAFERKTVKDMERKVPN